MRTKILFIFFILFTTLEGFATIGKWMRYPAISPDGQTIVFSYAGDLYLVPSKGGLALPLTSHKGHDSYPVWSHDGSTIAFASFRHASFDVFTIPSSGGTPTRLTYHSADDIPSSFSPNDKHILFSSGRMKTKQNVNFPTTFLPELYQISIKGGRPKMILSTPALHAHYNTNGTQLIYEDLKGYENEWRKHHQSAVTRDIWTYDFKSKQHQKITDKEIEYRNPVWKKDNHYYYLSEESGSFNVWEHTQQSSQPITKFKDHPVRFLTSDKNETLCFAYGGDLYLKEKNKTSKKIKIEINRDFKTNDIYRSRTSSLSEFDISPNGEEMVFITNGDVYVSSTTYGTTKRITDTPYPEMHVSFTDEGKNIIYTSERDGKWNLFQASRKDTTEKYFFLSSIITEKTLYSQKGEVFQPKPSPDGKKIAFFRDRTELIVFDIKTKKTTILLSGHQNYSYVDRDQWFSWSPTSDWIATQTIDKSRWGSEITLVKADGTQSPVNLTKSGYSDEYPRWSKNGEIILWVSDRHGLKSHGGWGTQYDVYGMFLTHKAYEKHHLSKSEFELYDELHITKVDSTDTIKKELEFDLEHVFQRKVKLTQYSGQIYSYSLSKNANNFYYLIKNNRKIELWKYDIHQKERRKITSFSGRYGHFIESKKDNELFVAVNGKVYQVNCNSSKKTPFTFSAETTISLSKRRDIMFDHVWKQIRDKFYLKNLHGVDWKYLKEYYRPFLAHINNNFDFQDLLSEMLGELNVSHTGAKYRPYKNSFDVTGRLGVFFDLTYNDDGYKIDEIITNGPCHTSTNKIKAGTFITAIDGIKITKDVNIHQLLNGKTNRRISIQFKNKEDEWSEFIRPISTSTEHALLYNRWVENNKKRIDNWSNGTIGYVHIKSMNDANYRKVYDQVLGENGNKNALVIDTRFNGGGWLHDDLANLFSGQKYWEFIPRGNKIGEDPIDKWTKPTILVMSESNYSNAYMFPYLYQQLQLGKLVGMPVPGTGTAVWWEVLYDRSLYFGIPQVGIKTNDGKWMENTQLEPNIKTPLLPNDAANGFDSQLKRATLELLKK